MIWKADFMNKGAPALGLTPTIRIRDLSDNSLIVTDEVMTEVGDGSYKYDHTGYDATKNYSARCDGGASLSNYDRYTYGSNRDDLGMSGKLPANYFMGSSVSGDKDGNIDNIEEDTETTIPDLLSTIQADLDNPNQYKANISALATEANATTNKNSIITEVNANETKIDSLQSDVTNIKTKTDNLPSNTNTILSRILGIGDENGYIDNYGFEDGQMTGCRKRIYDSEFNAKNHTSSGLLGTYDVEVTYNTGQIVSYLMTLV